MIFWQKVSFIFVGKRGTIFAKYAEKIIFPCIFWERSSFTFHLEEISYFREKEMPSFLMVQERSCFGVIFFGKAMFSEHLKKISCLHVFPWERSSFRLKNNIFGEKKYYLSRWYKKYHIPVGFISYSSAMKDHLFRTFRKRKYGFSCSVFCFYSFIH